MPPTDLLLSLLDPSVRADPYPVYAALQRQAPVAEGPMGIVVVSGHAPVAALLRDRRLSSDYRNSSAFRAWLSEQDADLDAWDADDAQPFLLRDPPDHTRLRRLAASALAASALAPGALGRLEPRIAALTDGLLDVAAARAGDDGTVVDLVAEVAAPLPLAVIGELLGVPEGDRVRLQAWSHDLARAIDPPFLLGEAERAAAWEAVEAFHGYLADLVAARRRSPGQDVVSALIAARDEGAALSDEELRGIVVLLLAAGQETTVNLIANACLALLRHPDELARLGADPTRAASVTEETLRYDAPVQLRDRVALTDLRVGGVDVAAGTTLLLLLAAANRDPARFPAPERFDPDRDTSGHLGFGAGIHACLGAPLARLEARVVLERLATRLRNPHLATDDLAYRDHIALRSLRELPVVVDGIRPA